jgi:hypothetical protein
MARRRNVPMPPWSSIEAQSSKPAGRSNPVFHEPIEEPASRATPRPLDPEGIPFLTTADVAPHLGISHAPNFKEAAYGEVPHYVDTKNGSPQNTRVWFAMKDIVNHFAIKSGSHLPPEKKSSEQLAFAGRHKLWSERHQNALRGLESQRAEGLNPGNLTNQPHPGNKDIHTRLVYGVRRQSREGGEYGDMQGYIEGTGSNVSNPLRHGHMKPVEATSEDTTDFLDPRRPRRGR